MIKVSNSKGMTLVEVMIALVIIVGIAVVAYQYHLTLVVSNGELLQLQDSLLLEESDFDERYQMESL